jgi:hypothetical protein
MFWFTLLANGTWLEINYFATSVRGVTSTFPLTMWDIQQNNINFVFIYFPLYYVSK